MKYLVKLCIIYAIWSIEMPLDIHAIVYCIYYIEVTYLKYLVS